MNRSIAMKMGLLRMRIWFHETSRSTSFGRVRCSISPSIGSMDEPRYWRMQCAVSICVKISVYISPYGSSEVLSGVSLNVYRCRHPERRSEVGLEDFTVPINGLSGSKQHPGGTHTSPSPLV